MVNFLYQLNIQILNIYYYYFFRKLKRKEEETSAKKKNREKEEGSQQKQKQKMEEKNLKRNDSIGGCSSSELESSVGFLGKIKNGVGCANVGEDREGLGLVGDKEGIRLK